MFHQIRLELGLTQSEMAHRLGIALATWRRWERGQTLPGRPLLGPARICEEYVLEGRELLCWGQLAPFEMEEVSAALWRRSREFWNSSIRRFGLDAEVCEWLEQTCRCDSALEAFAWYQLAQAGARPLLANPHRLGFRALPIVDARGRALGERHLPGLRLYCDRRRWLVWPQVPLLADGKIFRCDGLILNQPGIRPRWQILEFDGAGHDFSKDEYRRRMLGLAEVRISGSDIKSIRTLERFLQLLPQRKPRCSSRRE